MRFAFTVHREHLILSSPHLAFRTFFSDGDRLQANAVQSENAMILPSSDHAGKQKSCRFEKTSRCCSAPVGVIGTTPDARPRGPKQRRSLRRRATMMEKGHVRR